MAVRTTNRPSIRLSLLPLALGLIATAGCSYFDAPDPTAEQINLMAGESVEVVQEAEMPSAPIEPITFDAVAQASSNSNVQVYGFGENGGILTPISSTSPRTSSSSSSVEVFPLDGAPVIAPSMPAAVPVVPVTTAAPIVPSSNGNTRIYFEHGSANLNAQDKAVLNNVSQAIGNRPVKVVGYASTEAEVSDPVTRKAVNLRESLNRAYAVAKDLIGQGVPAEQIETIGMGENVSSASASDARRVEIQPQ